MDNVAYLCIGYTYVVRCWNNTSSHWSLDHSVSLKKSVSVLKKMSFSRGLQVSSWKDHLCCSGHRVTFEMRFWDPAGFTADGSVEDFKRRRQTELKHGRISMLATMGYITPERLVWTERVITQQNIRMQGNCNSLCFTEHDVYSSVHMTRRQPLSSHSKSFAWQAQIIVICLLIDKLLSNFGCYKLGTELWTTVGAVLMISHPVVAWSHSFAFYWLPATWPRITGKLPGYLSPSAGLKFVDVPNGLAAISKVPAAGWGQILAYMAFCEVSQDQSPGTPAAAGDFGFKVLTSSDPEEKTKKLSAELANGRLAMMAIIGMFFQEIISCFKTLEEFFDCKLVIRY